MHYDQAVHSDFLIHWTGKDIDGELDPEWSKKDKSQTSDTCTSRYVERLKDTLSYGLWMTIEQDSTVAKLSLPDTAKCCFTELKLSQSRVHAGRYGRLGFGFKRPFRFDRLGRPVCYYGFDDDSDDAFRDACSTELSDTRLLHFFKAMNSSETLNYDYYGESEWRIIALENLVQEGKIIDPRDPTNTAHHEFFKSLSDETKNKLGYFIPFDGWFSMLIYPSISVKNCAQSDDELRDLIRKIKEDSENHANRVENGNWPIEIDLDACRHF